MQHHSPPLYPILGQFNQIHKLYFKQICFNTILPSPSKLCLSIRCSTELPHALLISSFELCSADHTVTTGKPFCEVTHLTGWVTVSRSTPVGSNCRRALIAATYAVNTSGVLTPGCSNRVSRARCNFCVKYNLKSVFCRQIRKSSTAGCESGYSKKKNK
jgi:hypothetical protein